MNDTGLQGRIVEALRRISAHQLQRLAEAIAIQKFSDRFRRGTMIRNGRNDDAQTTKNWPDAYVLTSSNTVDGVEATRDKNSWKKHLATDLEHARDPNFRNLSGYLFVGGYPDSAPTSEETRAWITSFAALGIPYDRITILVGRDLVAELEEASYARIRSHLLGLSTRPTGFRPLTRPAAASPRLDVFQPTEEEFERGYVGAPALLRSVIDGLARGGGCFVRGVGAAGKTTLARLVAHSDQFVLSPTWLLDLTNPAFDEDEAINGMSEGAGEGVLFVIDNIHMDVAAADRLVRHWRDHLRCLGTRVLLLGRKTRSYDPDLAGLTPLELRAGQPEMRAVVARLFHRRRLIAPSIGQSFLDTWAIEFGGTSDPSKVAVDLVAFTAAVEERMDDFVRGDFRLEAEDAIKGVRARYLEPLIDKTEREDLLRLASLAHFEIPIFAELLDNGGDFTTSIDELGIVIEDQTGLERRRSYRLVHHGIGKLLLKAASDFQAHAAREAIARRNPSIGARMVSNKRQAPGKHEIERAMVESLKAGEWKASVRDAHDLATIVRQAIGRRWVTANALDEEIAADYWLRDILETMRSLRGVNVLHHCFRRFGLPRSFAQIGSLAADPNSQLHATALVSGVSEVAGLLRGNPMRQGILDAISTAAWDERQANVPVQTADVVVSAGRLLERAGRADLARVPCLAVVRSADPALWIKCDLGDLSNVLRLAGHPEPDTKFLLDTLFATGWVERVYQAPNLGPLCGGLMSLANHLMPDHQPRFLTEHLEVRVQEELKGEFWIDNSLEEYNRQSGRGSYGPTNRHDHEGQRWLPHKLLSRPVCLLGSHNCLGGTAMAPAISWTGPLLERMFDGLRRKNEAGVLGMYELQFWIGLKVLAGQGRAPTQVSAHEGERFLTSLEASDPPTAAAAAIQASLLAWLRACQSRRWVLADYL